jgi:branched-chain amino acid transport system permease protein
LKWSWFSLDYIIEQLINGISQGAIYALFAIGFALIVGVVGLSSFTHGEVIMIGSFAVYYCTTFVSSNLFLNIIASFFITGLLGVVIHKICYERFSNAPHYIPLVCTIGISMLIKNLAQILFGSETKAMPQIIEPGFFELGTVRVSHVQLTVLAVVVLLCVALTLFLYKTKYGRILRAVSQDKKAAALVGVDVQKATLLGNVIGCGIGGIGGALYAIYYSTFSPTMGLGVAMKAFAATVLGGMTDITMSAIGGLSIGVLENLGIMVLSSSLRDLIAYLFLIIVLLFLPKGLKVKGGRNR